MKLVRNLLFSGLLLGVGRSTSAAVAEAIIPANATLRQVVVPEYSKTNRPLALGFLRSVPFL